MRHDGGSINRRREERRRPWARLRQSGWIWQRMCSTWCAVIRMGSGWGKKVEALQGIEIFCQSARMPGGDGRSVRQRPPLGAGTGRPGASGEADSAPVRQTLCTWQQERLQRRTGHCRGVKEPENALCFGENEQATGYSGVASPAGTTSSGAYGTVQPTAGAAGGVRPDVTQGGQRSAPAPVSTPTPNIPFSTI